MKKTLFFSGLIALLISLGSIGLYHYFSQEDQTVRIEHLEGTPSSPAVYTLDEEGSPVLLDFRETADKTLAGVVHIKSTRLFDEQPYRQRRSLPAPFRDFFGDEFDQFFGRPGPRGGDAPARVGTGSGVIISPDGYIVTNNHVIAEADDIEVTLHDNRTFKATLIGNDPSTDLALLQIRAKDLSTVPFADSDEVYVGQWVVAVGNPLGLNSTVTAGIVSAKGRAINILKDQYAVENFIQTDAAINPGNSGGALVNIQGGLVGINTAIASPTGTFAGYGFAVPANIVQKVVEDLIEYGTVQRGVLGVMIRTVNSNLAQQEKLDVNQGVFVDSLLENSAAAEAGLQVGDVITAVNDRAVNTSPELQGLIARYRPGEEVKLTINRQGQQKSIKVTLSNRAGTTELATVDTREIVRRLGIELAPITEAQASELNIAGGVQIKKLYPGKLRRDTRIREGFIITHLNGEAVKDVDTLIDLLEKQKGGIMLEGIYEDLPGKQYYAFGLEG